MFWKYYALGNNLAQHIHWMTINISVWLYQLKFQIAQYNAVSTFDGETYKNLWGY
jgi:hypothetical protein